jgi:hypothetical protein
MNKYFQEKIDQLHDARVFGFLFDNDRTIFKSNFYIYIQLFGDYENESYELKKALLRFNDIKIESLSIENDLSSGQYFISSINIEKKSDELYRFNFVFSSAEIELNLLAADFEMIVSDKIEYSLDQYLRTDWLNLLI